MPTETRHRANTGKIAHRKIAGETILVPIASEIGNLDKLFQLNETAAFIWERACEGKPVDAIAADLAEAFEVSPDTARADTEALVRELVDMGALVPMGEEDPA